MSDPTIGAATNEVRFKTTMVTPAGNGIASIIGRQPRVFASKITTSTHIINDPIIGFSFGLSFGNRKPVGRADAHAPSPAL
jgi:hypothetical protein